MFHTHSRVYRPFKIIAWYTFDRNRACVTIKNRSLSFLGLALIIGRSARGNLRLSGTYNIVVSRPGGGVGMYNIMWSCFPPRVSISRNDENINK